MKPSMTILSTLALLVLPAVLAAGPQEPGTEPETRVSEQEQKVLRADGSEIVVKTVRPTDAGSSKIPIVMAVDGSLCLPSDLSSWISRLSPEVSGLGPYALVVVEKPGPTIPEVGEDGSIRIGPDFRCSETFKRYYSIDRRVLDHLRAIQTLRRDAPWWDGRLYLWGFSDGGRIAAQVGALTPETRRMVLGGFGGGTSMAEDFEDFHICAEGKTEDRAACLAELRSQFDAMRDNPTHTKTWNGDANTWKVWASRLDDVAANILQDVTVPVLVFHGTKDGSTPVTSARRLAERLSGSGGPQGFEYREIEGMGHGLGSRLPDEQAARLHEDFLRWLLDRPRLSEPSEPTRP